MTPTMDNPMDEQSRDGLLAITEYFVRNYPGPNTIIGDPHWHAPKIFRAAQYAIEQAALSRPSLEPTLGSHTEGVGAMPTARSGVLRTEPEDVSSLRAPATIAKGEAL